MTMDMEFEVPQHRYCMAVIILTTDVWMIWKSDGEVQCSPIPDILMSVIRCSAWSSVELKKKISFFNTSQVLRIPGNNPWISRSKCQSTSGELYCLRAASLGLETKCKACWFSAWPCLVQKEEILPKSSGMRVSALCTNIHNGPTWAVCLIYKPYSLSNIQSIALTFVSLSFPFLTSSFASDLIQTYNGMYTFSK